MDKRSICRYDDYIEPKGPSSLHSNTAHWQSLSQFKLDRIFPRNISMRFNNDAAECKVRQNQSKFLHQYQKLKENHHKYSKKAKISHIFNIRSINLQEKIIQNHEKTKNKRNFSREMKRSSSKEELRGLNLILVDKKQEGEEVRKGQKKNSVPYLQKSLIQNKSSIMKGSDNFQNRLEQYLQFLREQAEQNGIKLQEVQSYPRNCFIYSVGRGNNVQLVKQLLKKRWWWTPIDDKNKKTSNFNWTQLKDKTYFYPPEPYKNSLSTIRSHSQGKTKQVKTDWDYDFQQLRFHNHFQNNQFLGNKKALYYNMKAYYERHRKNVFNYLPVTFHVRRYDDQTWKEFSRYFLEDQHSHVGQRRLWIVKPGQNTNRGNGITIFSDYQQIRLHVQREICGQNNLKKTFIIQKYIDHPLLYNRRKFDIRCYMLLSRLNGKLRGYWYEQGYIRTSCFQFQLNDTQNQFIHLTNDAIQANSQKYGKYEEGNKLSYQNFQKYLDSLGKNRNFVDEIVPQLKAMGRDAIEATWNLLGGQQGPPTFEIFGLDFMIDEDFKPWFIEVNTNPCLETSCATLDRVIPRMLDNAFKLTLDILAAPPQLWPNSKKHFVPSKAVQNLFQLVFQQTAAVSSVQNDVIVEMGEIEDEDEVYDQRSGKSAQL